MESYKAFTHETRAKKLARKKKYQKEKKEAEIQERNGKVFQEEVGNSMSSLAGIIAQRNEDRQKKQDAFLDQLAAKYVKPKKSSNARSSSSLKKSETGKPNAKKRKI